MSGIDWERLEALFHGALEQPETEREQWLRKACQGDEALFTEVIELLDNHARDDQRVESAIGRTAAQVRGGNEPVAGLRLGSWRVLSQIGAGGMGSVYLAERADDEYAQKVAIKVIRGFPDRDSLERLRLERQILADLNHPNIARIIDGGTTDQGQPFIVMDYVEGLTIDQWCQHRRSSERETIRLVMTICEAVHYAHQRLVIHRDIKPANILVNASGHPFLMDFGIAKLIHDSDDAESEQSATRGVRFYTPWFASPEQLAGRPISTASDVYSLGRLLLRLLRPESSARRASDPPASQTAAISRLPRDLAAIIERATRDEPDRRYPSAAALSEDLQRYLSGDPVNALSGRLGYRAGKFARKYWVPMTAVLVAAIIGFGLVWRLIEETQRALAAERVAIAEAQNSDQVLNFLISMIGSVHPGESMGEDVSLREVVERGRNRIFDQEFADPIMHARILHAMGEVYQALLDNERASELLALAAEKAFHAGDLAQEVRSRSMLTISLIRLHELDEAGSQATLIRDLAERHPEIDPEIRATAFNNWALWAVELARYDEARESMQKAFELRSQAGSDLRLMGISLHNLGFIENRAGDQQAALEWLLPALELKAQVEGRNTPTYGYTLSLLAQTYRRLGEFARVREVTEELIEVETRLYGADSLAMRSTLNEAANLYLDFGEYSSAIETFERLLEIDAGSGRETVGHTAVYLNNLGYTQQMRENLPEAERLYRQSHAIRVAQLGAGAESSLRTAFNIANVIAQSGHHEQAAELFEDVLEKRRALLGKDHADVLRAELAMEQTRARLAPDTTGLARVEALTERLADRFGDNSWVMINARAELGRMHLMLGNLEEARVALARASEAMRQLVAPDHPQAARFELDLIHIDLLQGDQLTAAQRLDGIRATIEKQFYRDGPSQRLIRCLEENLDAECWQQLPPVVAWAIVADGVRATASKIRHESLRQRS